MLQQVASLRKLLREPPVPVLSRLSGLDDAELEDRLRMVAHLKRFLERYCADSDFRQRLDVDIQSTLDSLGLLVDAADARAVIEINQGRPVEWTRNLHRFRDFMLECQGGLEYGELAASSTNAQFRAWRQRQIARLRFDFSRYGDGIVRPAAALELSKGCTVGCWFCAISAERFGGNIEYESGRELWRDTLQQLSAVLGPAVASSVCYWATDPFDNPNYERFALDLHEISGEFPATTTALPLASPQRTRALLELSQAHGCRLNRFSVLTRGMLNRLHREFTAEELVLVELVLQQPDALVFTSFPSTARAAKVRAGRVLEQAKPEKLGAQQVVSGTIACIVGFLINMVEHTVQLVSPCTANKEWPLGYRIHASDTFMDGWDLRKRLEQMIGEHAPERIPPQRRVGLNRGITYSPLHDGFRLSTPLHAVEFRGGSTDRVLGDLIHSGGRSAVEITAELEANGSSAQQAVEALNAVFSSGAISDGVTNLSSIDLPVQPKRSTGVATGLITTALLLALSIPGAGQTTQSQSAASATPPQEQTIGIASSLSLPAFIAPVLLQNLPSTTAPAARPEQTLSMTSAGPLILAASIPPFPATNLTPTTGPEATAESAPSITDAYLNPPAFIAPVLLQNLPSPSAPAKRPEQTLSMTNAGPLILAPATNLPSTTATAESALDIAGRTQASLPGSAPQPSSVVAQNLPSFTVPVVAQNLPSPAAPPTRTIGIVEAGQIAIDHNPILQIQKQQVNFSQGSLLVEQGIFDLNLGVTANQGRNYSALTKSASQSALQAGIDTGSQNANTTNSNLSAGKLFRSGISVSPVLRLVRSTDNLTNQTGLNNSTMGVQVVLPLLRNRGRAVVAARETSAILELNASGYDLSQTASQLLSGVAISYWNYLGALQSLEIFRSSEQRGQTLLDNVRALATADIIPRIEIDNAVANLASRTATRISAEQNAVVAQQQLAIAMGLDASEVMDLPPPGDPFPDGTTAPLLPTDVEKLRQYIQTALSRRADYLAAKTRSQEARVLLGAAHNQLKPQIDFVGNIGYSGLQETTRVDKYLSSSFQNIYGPSVVGGIEYHFPLQNRTARGQVIQSEASLQQQDLRVTDIARNVASNVITAATGLNNSVLQLNQAREASASFRAALDGERERLRLGAGSVLDVLQTEDRYINSTVNEVSAKVAYAIAIANFRLATGTYLQPDQPVQSVAREAFYVPIVP